MYLQKGGGQKQKLQYGLPCLTKAFTSSLSVFVVENEESQILMNYLLIKRLWL